MVSETLYVKGRKVTDRWFQTWFKGKVVLDALGKGGFSKLYKKVVSDVFHKGGFGHTLRKGGFRRFYTAVQENQTVTSAFWKGSDTLRKDGFGDFFCKR